MVAALVSIYHPQVMKYDGSGWELADFVVKNVTMKNYF